MDPRIKIFNENPCEEPRPELFLALKEVGNHVELDAVTENGEYIPGGCLLTISKRGIRIEPYVSHEVPLPKDENKRVVVKKG